MITREVEQFVGMHFVQMRPPRTREDGIEVRIFCSNDGVVRVVIENSPDSASFLYTEAYYNKSQVLEWTGNIHTGAELIENAWIKATDERFQDPSLDPVAAELEAQKGRGRVLRANRRIEGVH